MKTEWPIPLPKPKASGREWKWPHTGTGSCSFPSGNAVRGKQIPPNSQPVQELRFAPQDGMSCPGWTRLWDAEGPQHSPSTERQRFTLPLREAHCLEFRNESNSKTKAVKILN